MYVDFQDLEHFSEIKSRDRSKPVENKPKSYVSICQEDIEKMSFLVKVIIVGKMLLTSHQALKILSWCLFSLYVLTFGINLQF